MPFILLVVWNLAGLVIAFANPAIMLHGSMQTIGWIVMLAAYGYVGWSAVRKHEATIAQGTWAGTFCGLLEGLAGGIIGLMIIFLVPDFVQIMVSQTNAKIAAANPSAPSFTMEQMEKWMVFGAVAGLILGPIIQGLIGAGVAALAGVIAKPKKKTPPLVPQEFHHEVSQENPNPSATE